MDLAWGYMTGDLFLHMLHTHLPSEQGLRVPDPVVETPVTQALLPCCIFSWVYIYTPVHSTPVSTPLSHLRARIPRSEFRPQQD